MSAGARAEESVKDAAPASAVAAAPGAAAGALAGLGPQQRLALQLQGAGGNAAVARMLRGGGSSVPGAAGLGGGVRPPAPIIPMPGPTGPTVAREPAAAPAAPGAAPAAAEDDWVTSAILSVVREIPGYNVATLIAGADPITGRPVAQDRRAMVEQILGHGPFAAGVGPVLATLDIIDQVIAVVTDGLASHQLSFARIRKDFTDCWNEIHVVDGVDANVAKVRRYVDRLLADIRAFATEIAGRLIEMVRAAAAKVAEPLLQRPEIAPIWNLAKKVMKYDPLKGEAVAAPTVEILADFLKLIGQEQRLAQMQQQGTLQRTADWLDTQFSTFTDILSALKQLFSDAWAAISPTNLPKLLDTLPGLAQRALGLMGRIRDFATTVIGTVLKLIKDALVGLLAQHADKIPGFRLLTVILGRNPFTGEVVPRTAESLIRGFITLLPGGEAMYDQLAESGVIGSAAARIEGAIDKLGISWDLITGTFRGIWDSLKLDDLLDPIGAFSRILDRFGEPLGRITAFVGEVVQAVVELILAAMNFPSELLGSIVANAKRAYADIKKDPVAFLKNVLAALKDGLSGFLSNIVTYLKDGLVNWLTRGLGKAGVQLPSDWSMGSILKLVMDVLGIGIEKLWEKLGKKIGPEKVAKIRGVINKLEGAWEWIRDVMENGIGALWKHLADQLGNLWDSLLGMARDWVMGELIEKALARLVSMLDPTGIMAIIRTAQAFFNAIQSAIEYLRDILTIVNDYVSTLAEVAAGNISAGAKKMEQGLASAIPVALGFLANQVGITDVPEKIAEIIGKLREVVDKALDWLVDKAWAMGKSALSALGVGGGAGAPADGDDKKDAPKPGEPAKGLEGVEAPFHEGKDGHRVLVESGPSGAPQLMVRSTPQPFEVYLAHVRTHLSDVPEARKADAQAALADVEKLADQVRKVLPKAAPRPAGATAQQNVAAGAAARDQEAGVATEVQRLIAAIATRLESVNGLIPGMSSPRTVPARVLAAIDREAAKFNSQTLAARRTAGASPEELEDRALLGAKVGGMTRHVAEINRAMTEHANPELATAGLQGLRQLTVDYLDALAAVKAKRGTSWSGARGGLGASSWGPARPGDVAAYSRMNAPGQLKEHVVPASLSAGMMGMTRTDPGFAAVDGGLTTIAWPTEAAHLKTYGKLTIGGATLTLTRHLGDNVGGTEHAAGLTTSRGQGYSGAFDDRLGAALEAAAVIRAADSEANPELAALQRKLPTDSAIRGAAVQQWNTMFALMQQQGAAMPPTAPDAPGSPADGAAITDGELAAAFAEWPAPAASAT